MAKTFQNIPTPFTNMSFTPDVPAGALQANEYNAGKNIQTNVRGVETIAGDQEILSPIPGEHLYVSAGYRANGVFWFIVGTTTGDWYMTNATGAVVNITPTVPAYKKTGYNDNTSITECWNGEVLFLNDGINPPMYLLSDKVEIRLYDTSYPDQTPNTYVWNYTPGWTSSTAGFVRMFSTPNVGSILIAGDITAQTSAGFTVNYPTTVQWSQAFGLNAGPTSWDVTIDGIANQLEVPVRGPVVDGFPCNGNFFVCSYWDTVIFSPIAYQGTNYPVLGVRLLNVGRGLLNENCWSTADQVVYGLDARDIWVFDGNSFKSLGNQRVKDFFYANINPLYTDHIYTINNTALNQFEIYYPDLNSTDGWCNQMLSYRYDLNIFNAPRDVSSGSHACESPRWTGNANNPATRAVVYSRGGTTANRLIQKDTGTTFINNQPIPAVLRRDNITFGQPYSNQILVHRILPMINGTGNIRVSVGGALSIGQTPVMQPAVTMPINTDNPWIQTTQNDYRVVSLEISSENSTQNQWNIGGVNWQVTVVEDSR